MDFSELMVFILSFIAFLVGIAFLRISVWHKRFKAHGANKDIGELLRKQTRLMAEMLKNES
ncbi:hypothetical protein GZH53_15840 [Flavihumibacter sp. R14]|nr:hypothetical protein [Flavihumibacter soli]